MREVIGVNKIWPQDKLPQNEEFFDALRRHICHTLGYDLALIDVVCGHEVVNLLTFANEDNSENPAWETLKDEYQQPLTVAHTLTAQKVKQTQKAWLGHVQDDGSRKYPYLIVPVVEQAGNTLGLIRVVAFDQTRNIGRLVVGGDWQGTEGYELPQRRVTRLPKNMST